jgi:hypothetical protein
MVTHTNEQIARVMRELPAVQRHVVELKFFQNFTFEDMPNNWVSHLIPLKQGFTPRCAS